MRDCAVIAHRQTQEVKTISAMLSVLVKTVTRLD